MDLILGAPRRRWARGEKLAAVAATFSPGITVTEVARNLGIRTSMLYTWRKTLRAEAGFPEVARAPSFVPVTVTPDPVGCVGVSPAAVAGPGTIEISFTHAPQMRIIGGVDPVLATALVAALSAR
jgi:transposase